MSGENLQDPVSELKGVGPKQMQRFGQLGIQTVGDLMYHFPFRYEDIQERDLETIFDNEKVTLKGQIVTPPVVNYFGGKKSRLSFRLAVSDSDIIQVTFFNQPYLKNQITEGEVQAIYGKWQSDRQSLLGMKLIRQSQDGKAFSPVYPSTQGLSQGQITKAIGQTFEDYQNKIEEILPVRFNDKYSLSPLNDALYQMHFPDTKEAHHQATRKIIYQEFFLYQWQLSLAKYKQKSQRGIRVLYDVDDLKGVIKTLPFELTADQKGAINEICYDLLADYPLRRMLQGDVGSGKTLVAFLAMIATVQAGYQTVLMVPTEILAKQHVESFNQFFEAIGLRAEILISGMTPKDKQAVIDGLKHGRIRVVIGTHALIQPTIIFDNLGLVIIDEQHRFGVGQRHSLLSKGEGVNLLQMTATPIPRSLALAVYGEMSVSTIENLPKGRQPITTKLVPEESIESMYQFIEGILKKGQQVYYVLPLIESSEAMEQIENVMAVYERLVQRYSDYHVGVLHGQLDKEAQQKVMESFKANETNILVATTMVEVGVDVPNATVIVIQSAERFGLAQLHQLRGRVGRSSLASYCFLIAAPTTDQGKQRMQIMVDTQDGFKISREDLKLRGMGDILGHVQSGIPTFNYANLIEDNQILEVARHDVNEIIKQPTLIETEELERLNQWVKQQVIEI